MSLKSFDKFCENLILTEPGSEKIIYDERQKIVQMKIGIETLIIFGAAAVINCFVMDLFYQYAESYTMPIVMIMLFCAFYHNFRCAAKDCLIGINGVGSMKFSAALCIFYGVIWTINYALDEKEESFPLVDGKLCNDLFFLITAIIAVVYGITMLILVHHIEKKKNEKTE